MSKMVNRSKGTGTEFVNAQLIDLKDLIDYYAKKIKKPKKPKPEGIVAYALPCNVYVAGPYANIWICPDPIQYYPHPAGFPREGWFFVGRESPGYAYVTQYNGTFYAISDSRTHGYLTLDSTGMSGGVGSNPFIYGWPGSKTMFTRCTTFELISIPESTTDPKNKPLKKATIIY